MVGVTLAQVVARAAAVAGSLVLVPVPVCIGGHMVTHGYSLSSGMVEECSLQMVLPQ